MKLNKDTVSENKHENNNVYDVKSSSRSFQSLVNVYECLGMELQVDKYLENVSHLLYECTRKKFPSLCVWFCWCCRHLGCTFETEPVVVTARACAHGLSDRPLVLFSCRYLSKRASRRQTQTEHFTAFRTGFLINSTDYCLPRLAQLGTASANT